MQLTVSELKSEIAKKFQASIVFVYSALKLSDENRGYTQRIVNYPNQSSVIELLITNGNSTY